jgi:serine/threonine-protein kinase RsbW
MATLKKTMRIESNLEEIAKLDGFLEGLFDELSMQEENRDRVRLSLHEGVANAIKHGNKFDQDKSVKLCAMHFGNHLEFEIIDEGDGFELKEVDDPLDPANLLKDSGRGVFLMRMYADEVSYTQGGRQLNIRFNL